jgi:ribosomal peptide maturation radical SAM protein 1
LHRLAPEYVRGLAERMVEKRPDFVGFTSAFQQSTSALALARYIKQLNPAVHTVMGGGSCDGQQGAAVHRNFPFIDFVMRGEGERALPQLIHAVSEGWSLKEIDGLCWSDPDGRPVVNPLSVGCLPPSEMVAPDFTSYFDRLATSVVSHGIKPKLVVESSRGCWWGEKHHCAFCGLNGLSLEFRGKDPDVFYTELMSLVDRHKVRDVLVVDNILDPAYFTSLLPRIAASGRNLHVRCAVKSNLDAPQMQVLAEAGFVEVQAGIENLSSRVLEIMNKGVTGCQNVRILRDAQTSGVTIRWNYLFGFPGETDEDYQSVVDQMPALHHLMPATGAYPIVIERFSPYFDQPELGFADRSPTRQYKLIYDLPESELEDLAYLFGVSAVGIDDPMVATLRAAIEEWRGARPTSSLTHHDLGGEIILTSSGRQVDWHTLRLVEPMEIDAFRLLDQPITQKALVSRLSADASRVAMLLRTWRAAGIVFEDGDQFVHVAPRSMSQEPGEPEREGEAAV